MPRRVGDRRRGDLVRDAAEDARRPREVRKRLPRRVEQVGLRRADFGRAEFRAASLAKSRTPWPQVQSCSFTRSSKLRHPLP